MVYGRCFFELRLFLVEISQLFKATGLMGPIGNIFEDAAGSLLAIQGYLADLLYVKKVGLSNI